jgi:hypothetical protein
MLLARSRRFKKELWGNAMLTPHLAAMQEKLLGFYSTVTWIVVACDRLPEEAVTVTA